MQFSYVSLKIFDKQSNKCILYNNAYIQHALFYAILTNKSPGQNGNSLSKIRFFVCLHSSCLHTHITHAHISHPSIDKYI